MLCRVAPNLPIAVDVTLDPRGLVPSVPFIPPVPPGSAAVHTAYSGS